MTLVIYIPLPLVYVAVAFFMLWVVFSLARFVLSLVTG